ncbi:MAG: acyltransferase [Clostridiales bacterium]|nr:acyltransferase [Clostridiales bacterium]
MIQKQKQVKERNSAIELLRIITMVMIIFHHFSLHGGFEFSSVSVNLFWYNFIVIGGKIGVNVFIIISGYHLISNDKRIFDLTRIAKFWGQVFFYSIAIYLVFGLTGVSELKGKALVEALLPITFSEWWFASGYFVLYLLHPFLNKLLRSLDKALYQKLILLLVVCWCIIPTVTTSAYEGNALLWFITLYTIAGYIRLHGLNEKFTTKHYVLFLLISVLISYGATSVIAVVSVTRGGVASNSPYLYGQEKITTLAISLSLFMVFATMKMKHHRWINVIASTTFGIYLLHDHDVTRAFLWESVFKNALYQGSWLLIPYSIMAVAIVFVIGAGIDLIRQMAVEKPFMLLARYVSNKKITPFGRLGRALKKFFFGEQGENLAQNNEEKER